MQKLELQYLVCTLFTPSHQQGPNRPQAEAPNQVLPSCLPSSLHPRPHIPHPPPASPFTSNLPSISSTFFHNLVVYSGTRTCFRLAFTVVNDKVGF